MSIKTYLTLKFTWNVHEFILHLTWDLNLIEVCATHIMIILFRVLRYQAIRLSFLTLLSVGFFLTTARYLQSYYGMGVSLFFLCRQRSCRGVLDTTLCEKICQWLATSRWFSPSTPVSSTNKTDHHDITEILLKVALNTINPPLETQKYFHHNLSSIWTHWSWHRIKVQIDLRDSSPLFVSKQRV